MKCKDCEGDCTSLLEAMKESLRKRECLALVEHILALETDPYLQGHPEWEPLLNEAMLLRNRA